ncbi:FecR family protein [Filimonas effusa]|uniref:FecR family protein n=1 Tax=Filimonas effusa TaxID=2508721 RepID=A0A4Q1DCU9_9BACT|nr:FecR family protein [Filimonas effusa]RXK86798.1 FecR family protein [Filimonas effusa]
MNLSQQRLVELYRKRVADTLSEAEAEEFYLLLTGPGSEQQLSAVLYEGWKQVVSEHNSAIINSRLSKKQIDALINSFPVNEATGEYSDEAPAAGSRVTFMRRWWTAAAAVLVLTAALWLAVSQMNRNNTPVIAGKSAGIAPGKDGAVLTLADGTQVLLDTIQNGVVAHQAGADIRIANGVLYYEGTSSQLLYNTMHTPKGRKYNITLPDGTLVWLNSGSSIHYPVAFKGKERRVDITGEVYMEVAKHNDPATGSRIPFLVNINNKAVLEVLGTHFNINAYDNEATINTTLLEGKIRLKKEQEQVLLEPGQQAQIEAGSAAPVRLIKHADVEQVIAWKNDLFNFEGASLEEAMRQLERWYDIEVSYKNGIPDVRLRGEMTKGVQLNQLLVALEQLGLRYKLEGRKLIILR